MGTLWNTYAFYVLYANIDSFDPSGYALEYDKLPPMDRWALSKLNSLVRFVDGCLEHYKLTEASRAVEDYMEDLSNWYVRRCRERFWAKGMEADKINAYMTLFTALETLVRLIAPFAPFLSEEIYQNLVRRVFVNAAESVHFCDYPVADEGYIDERLEGDMDFVLKAVTLGRAARNAAGLKNRQPLGLMYIKADVRLGKEYEDIITEELNVKRLEYTDDTKNFVSYKFKPQLKTIGPRYGKVLPVIDKILKEGDGGAFYKALNDTGEIRFEANGVDVILTREDVLIETVSTEGYAIESAGDVTVALCTALTSALIEEGFVREIVSKVQTMRKEAGFDVLDRINVYYGENAVIEGIFLRNADVIMVDVLAEIITHGSGGYVKEWNINGETVSLSVEKR
jgi:isoleucyl-tRNA synthetase